MANGEVATVNAPKLADGMTPIKYVGVDGTSSSDLATLTNGSKWANAMTKDGSMWVWIPRYAYKITSGYHQSGADINSNSPTLGSGTIEIAFLDKNNNFLDPNITGTVVKSGVNDSTYTDSTKWILEPAFEFGGDSIEGFWFAKFEASNTDGYGASSTTADNTELTLQVKPNVTSWRSITMLNMFIVCQELKSKTNYKKYFDNVTNIDTHMIKNVEWGATVYLAHSKYGANGKEVYINNNNGYKTGISGSTSTAGSSSSVANKYNTTLGINASTSKNIYGIYDMSGGAWDIVSACYTGYESQLTSNTNTEFINKYIDVYTNTYSISKYGDAVFETSNGTGAYTSWFKDYSYILNTSNPIIMRGGQCTNSQPYPGIFAFSYTRGTGAYNSRYFSPGDCCILR